MGVYGLTAVEAVKTFVDGTTSDPKDAWTTAVNKIIESSSGRKKTVHKAPFSPPIPDKEKEF